jgi:hypothetical protein
MAKDTNCNDREIIQETVSEAGSKITKGAKTMRSSITKGVKDLSETIDKEVQDLK